MRKLTIKRTKSFVGCLAKMKVYIEDPSASEITFINNVPCRKLGAIKNGEEQTYQIDNNAAKVFVIADKLSKGFCSEFYDIPEGEEDIALTGKNRFNPAAGNAFQFDNNTNEEVLKHRKKNTRKGIIVLIAAFIIGIIIGIAGTSGILDNSLSNEEAKPQTFTHEDMQITLTDDFYEENYEGFNVCYDSEEVAVFALKEDFSLMEGLDKYSIRQYGELVIESNLLDAEFTNSNEVDYYEYTATNPDSNETYYYFTTIHKSDDAFWIVQFATLNDNSFKYKDMFFEWAKSIEFTK